MKEASIKIFDNEEDTEAAQGQVLLIGTKDDKDDENKDVAVSEYGMYLAPVIKGRWQKQTQV